MGRRRRNMKQQFRICNASRMTEATREELSEAVRKGMDVSYNPSTDEMTFTFHDTSRYYPAVFDKNTIDGARRIILTKENNVDTDTRWNRETPALMDAMERAFGHNGTLVDYGCGIGRLSKGLCDIGFNVVGVDMSASMRRMAMDYVSSDRFSVVSPEEFKQMVADGFRCDFAIAVWVLQHCENPWMTFNLIRDSMKDGGLFFILNNSRGRALPVVTNGQFSWRDDKLDVFGIIEANMEKVEDISLPPEAIGLKDEFYKACLYRKPSNVQH